MSYGTTADWITYAAARGKTVTAGALADQALQRAQDYIQFTYVQRFAAGYDSSAANVEAAVYEAANLEMASPGFFSKTYTEADRKVLTGLDALSWTFVGKVRDDRSYAPRSSKIEALLWPYIARTYGAVVV